MSTQTPILDLKPHFDATVALGDAQVPIRVKRLTRAEWLEFKKHWDALMEAPRGDGTLSADARAERDRLQLQFIEDTIVSAISLDAGHIRVNGEWVTSGDGLVDVFYARLDVLTDLVAQVFVQHTLQPLLRKNSNSPRGSVPGSEQSIPTRGGDAPGPTAANAGSSSSAPTAGVAGSPGPAAAAPSSSGVTRADEERLVH